MTTKHATRAAGIILHPTSLPGPFGMGDLGPNAYSWVDALVHARQKWWQILPLSPTGYGDSPYQSFSAFAGNPYLVSPQFLAEDGLLEEADLHAVFHGVDRIDFGPVIEYKNAILLLAWERFQSGRGAKLKSDFEAFIHAEAAWLDDYALFMAAKDAYQGKGWIEWPTPARMRDDRFLKSARSEFAGSIGQHQFRQFLFFRQWRWLKDYANSRGVNIIGDIPIFVAGDSADVWANPHLYQLDADNRPTAVAGVPPDYFSATGQLWGNPLYDWKAMQAEGFTWWIARFRQALSMVDLIRVDHFRGFQAYWAVPAGDSNAINGQWVDAPGQAVFETLQTALGRIPIIAEDLGVITSEVDALRQSFGLPGMRVLQFAFGGAGDNPYLPHNYEPNTVAYTGTHDNDTSWGWYQAESENVRDHARRYLGRDGGDIAWDLIRAAWGSVANLAVAPLQDVLNLGTEARMNYPGKPRGNWAWRYSQQQLHPWILDRLAETTVLYGRA